MSTEVVITEVIIPFANGGEITLMTVRNYIAACNMAIRSIKASSITNKKAVIRKVKYMLGPTKQTPQNRYGWYMALMKMTGTDANRKEMVDWAHDNPAIPASGAPEGLYKIIIDCFNVLVK